MFVVDTRRTVIVSPYITYMTKSANGLNDVNREQNTWYYNCRRCEYVIDNENNQLQLYNQIKYTYILYPLPRPTLHDILYKKFLFKCIHFKFSLFFFCSEHKFRGCAKHVNTIQRRFLARKIINCTTFCVLQL